MSKEAETFDYIIVGGGTAGCVLAARLSEQSDVTVLLLEAGGKDDGFWLSIPAGFSKLLIDPKFNWRFATEPEDNVLGRTIVVPRGRGLGGSSSINGMIYVRGQPQDYDGWAQRGAAGWSFDDVLPIFKSLETYDGPAADQDGLRGFGGPVNITTVTERRPAAQAFLDAAQQAGFTLNGDYNGAQQEGFGWYQVNQRNGRRWSAADAYLKPALARMNLAVKTGIHVKRIDFSGKRAVGVTALADGEEVQFKARAEIILAAGAIQSPHLLELSGIGRPETLAAVGIPVQHALLGVGRNYIDHFATRMNWRVKLPVTLNEASRGWRLAVEVGKYFTGRKGILTLGTGMAYGFVTTRPELASPDVQYFFVDASYADAGTRKLDRLPGMTIGVSQMRPESRGTIHIKSPDPLVPPAIRPNFLAAREDQRTLVAGMQMAREIVGKAAMDRFRSTELSPGPRVHSDEEMLAFARQNGQTIYHPVGTCAMGRGLEAVVDERLRVHGLAGLRVVDASIMPMIVSGNTAAAVLMIGEKAALMIKADRKTASSAPQANQHQPSASDVLQD